MDGAQREILAGNLKRVRERIAAACLRVKRDPREVTLVAVTKSVGPEVMQALIELGVTDIGENRLQAAKEKFPQVPGLWDRTRVKRHFIGHLQTNKVKSVLELFDVIHSVDSLKLAEEIDRRARQLELPTVAAFIEVNVSGEESKQGLPAAEFRAFFMQALRLTHLEWQGLMTMAPLAEEAESVRPLFRRLREMASPFSGDEALLRLASLSMGMSNDFEVAIEEGATHVRIGTALFEGM
ncbi:YggS family pyridoxal phosphate-dependent enzyme [bacterium]|nr:MAG: YggS family pyridoxal phosphate-dependent enzyme [bacterium]RIK63053.1 MAG: YggS family pyridoxal phosphate-dependent enzyme [Planctomycetota bacterium]